MSSHIIIVFIFVLAVALISRRYGLIPIFVSLLWLFSFRTNEIPDTSVYSWMYEDSMSRMDVNEIGYLYICNLVNTYAGIDLVTFFLIQIAFCLIVWYNITKRILTDETDFGMCFLLFVAFYGFFYFGVTTRNALSEILVLCGFGNFLVLKNKKRYYFYFLFILLASLIHRSAAIFIVLLPILKSKPSTSLLFRCYFLCVVFWLLGGAGISRGIVDEFSKISLFSKLENYSTSKETVPSMLSLQILINLVLTFVAIAQKKFINEEYRNTYRYFLNLNMIGLVTLSLIWPVPTSYRFYNMFFFFNYILLYLLIFQNKNFKLRGVKSIMAVFVSIVYFATLIHAFPFMLIY